MSIVKEFQDIFDQLDLATVKLDIISITEHYSRLRANPAVVLLRSIAPGELGVFNFHMQENIQDCIHKYYREFSFYLNKLDEIMEEFDTDQVKPLRIQLNRLKRNEITVIMRGF